MPTWTAVDAANVRTMRELMENMRKDGWNVEVRFEELWIFIRVNVLTSMSVILVLPVRFLIETTYRPR